MGSEIYEFKMSEGMKYDSGKLRWDLIDDASIEDLVRVLTQGSEKYADNNWQGVNNFEARYFAALMRHLTAWRKGEKTDPESGLPHLAHCMANIMFLSWKDRQESTVYNEIIEVLRETAFPE